MIETTKTAADHVARIAKALLLFGALLSIFASFLASLLVGSGAYKTDDFEWLDDDWKEMIEEATEEQ